MEHAQHQHPGGGTADGDPQHSTVIKSAGAIEGFFQQRGGIAAALPLARKQRLTDLLTLGMVFHGGGVCLGVVQHRTVSTHPRQAVAVGLQRGEVVRPSLLHRGGGKAQLILQLLLLYAAEIFVKTAHNDDQAGQQHRAGSDHHRAKNLFCHDFASHR